MQPQLLITLCIAPGQIMLFFPSRTFRSIDSAKNPSPLLTFGIWHFAVVLMEGEPAIGFPLRLHHYHAVNHCSATRPKKETSCFGSLYLLRYFLPFLETYAFNFFKYIS